METNAALATAIATLTHVGLMVIGAIILLIVGRWLISFAVRMITRSLEKQRVVAHETPIVPSVNAQTHPA